MKLYDITKNMSLNEADLKQFLEQEGNHGLDKYLKVSRLVKRRTLAKEISDQGITVNGSVKSWHRR